MTSTILLIETAQGATVAVRFSSTDEAMDWEDAHPEVVALGTAGVVSRKEALSLGARS